MRDSNHVEIDVGGQGKSASVKELRNGEFPSIDSENAEDKTISAQRQFMAAIECVSDGFALFDADDRMVFCNSRFKALNQDLAPKLVPGVSFEELLRDDISANRILDALGNEEAFIRRRMEQHRNPSGPLVQQRRDGCWLELREERTPEGSTFLVNTDITERKRWNDELRKSEERFRDIAELASDWIWETGPDLRFTYLSGQCEQATGMKAEVFLGKTRQELIANDPNDSSLRRHLEDLEARRPFRDFDYTFVSASGKRLFFRINGKPVFDAAGRFQGYRGSGVNITERKRAEEALHTREAQLRGIMDNAPIEIVLKDMKWRYVLTNPRWQKNYNLTEEEAQGKTIRDLFPEEFANPLAAHELEAVETGKATVHEDKLPQSDGVHDFITINFPIRDTTGELVNFGTISIDITERKRAEQEIQKLNQDLERRVEERTEDLRAAQADILRQARMATLGQLTATVTHELRNPLGVIRTSNSVVRDNLNDCDSRVGRSLERIERSVIRCDRIIDELLDYTHIRQLELEPTPIDTWLEGVLEEQTLHTDITLRRDLRLPGVKVFLDQDRFRRAVINVFDNACQAMVGDGNGKIEKGEHILTIQTSKSNGRIEVVFEDNGQGIPPDVLPKIFEPMFSTKGFGVGLGLPVVKQIMEQHGGGIEIDSGQGRGTRTSLWLPSDHGVH